jgi:hypothetical protein
LPSILPRFFGKNTQNTASIPAFFAYESRQTSRQIRTTLIFRGPHNYLFELQVRHIFLLMAG